MNKKVLEEFEKNAIYFAGPKWGSRGFSIEQSMRIMNNYFHIYQDKRLVDVAREKNMDPWVLGQQLISRFMEIHTELDVDMDTITDHEHNQLVKEYLHDRAKK